ncbi:hypothetical protein [Roseixanthobacter pseudopolyaromaticivorans]|uniref:hypothetical protein n=1 Tax=Xanthobacteraceae TaxID=335928 RepID=UPI003728B331
MTRASEGASGGEWMAATRVAPALAVRPSGRQPLVLAALVLVLVALLAGAGLLWVVHGPTVFFDTLASGFATCL